MVLLHSVGQIILTGLKKNVERKITMPKAIPCTVICNTRNGYCLTPLQCSSIKKGIKYAKSLDLAYRIFVDGKCIKSGW